MFSEAQRACTLFVCYKTAVPCAVTGKRSKHHWTSQARFKAANPQSCYGVLKFGKWLPAGTPVLRNIIMHADMKEFMRKVRVNRDDPKRHES